MKKTLTKLLSLCLVLIMAAGLFAGCKRDDIPDDVTTQAPAEPTEKPDEPDEPTEAPATPEPTQEPAPAVNTLYLKPPYVPGMDMVSIESDGTGLYTAHYIYAPEEEYDIYLTCFCIKGDMPAEDGMESYILNAIGDTESGHDFACNEISPLWIPSDYACREFYYLNGGEEDTCNINGLAVFADGYAYFVFININAEYYEAEEQGIDWATVTCSFDSIPEALVEYPCNTQVLMLPEIDGLNMEGSDPDSNGIYSYTFYNDEVSFVAFCRPAAAANIPEEITDPETELPGIVASVYQDFTPKFMYNFSMSEMDSISTTEGESCRLFRLSFDADEYAVEAHFEMVMAISSEFVYVISSDFCYDNTDEWFSQVNFSDIAVG